MRALGHHLTKLPFKPVAALIISCAGRKYVLGGDLREEARAFLESAPPLAAMAGFPSFGEIAPLRQQSGYSASLLHNMTLVVVAIGEEDAS